MSQRNQPKQSKKDQILRRYGNGEDEDSDSSENQFGYGPSNGGAASFDLYSDSAIDRREADLVNLDPFGYTYTNDSGSRGAVGYNARYGSSFSSMSYSDEPLSLVMHGGRNDDFYKESSAIIPSNVNEVPRKKQKQMCRLCANHDIDELMKGHKHFCPYSKCTCGSCRITRNRQYYMKKQQSMTRKQEQDRLHGASNDNYELNQGAPIAPAVRAREYPDSRRREMEEDLADIDMSNFDEINELCKKGNKTRKGGK